jgi:poly(A) polymerase
MLKRLKRLLTGGARGENAAVSQPLPEVGAGVCSGPTSSLPPAQPTPLRSEPTLDRGGIDADAARIVTRLTRQGHTAYFVGGCVRDLLLRRRPKDFDIATSATPRQVKDLFRNCRVIGRRFKLAHIYFRNEALAGGEKIIEVSTFRAFVPGTEDSADLLITRDNVFGTPEEDARRRDFTVNGLFYDPESGKVIDHVGGLPDLDRRVLRTIGDPDIRLREDPVRILRAIKFAARLDFAIDPGVMAAMQRHRREISRCAPPRTLEEVLRVFRSGSALPAFALLGESRVLEVLLPEIDSALAIHAGLVPAYQGVLSEFDRRVQAGEDLPASVLVASLSLPLLPWQANPHGGGQDLMGAMAETIDPILERLRVPRRDAEQVRQILLSIRKLVPGYRAKRFSRAALAQRPYFPLLLQAFSIHCRAQRTWVETLHAWEELRTRTPAVEAPPAPRVGSRRGGRVPAGKEEHSGERTGASDDPRRRGRRRRRRRSAGADSA